MTEPQSWVLIGLFTTLMLGGMSLMTTLITRTMTSAVDGLRGELNGLRGEMNARFESVERQIAHLDRDVTVLTRRALDE